jgi:hypothetical protein
VTPTWYKQRNCWRVQIPASESETGKRVSRYFKLKEEAEQFIAAHRRTGSIALAELSIEEKHVLGLIRQSAEYTPDLLLNAWRQFQQAKSKANQNSITVAELTTKYYNRQVDQKRSKRTLSDDRWRLNKFVNVLGTLQAKDCASSDILHYLESIPPGTNRRSHFKTLKKLWRWAYHLAHVDSDPMARMRPLDAWGENVDFLGIPLFSRLLRVVQGKEEPSEGIPVTTEYADLLPYFVLSGLAGLRTCELIRSAPEDPVLVWKDILWGKKLIIVRDEVAKQTKARDRKRYVPLEPPVIGILKPLAGAGPVMKISSSYFHTRRRELAALMKIRLPENCFRNSYATYAQTFRSLGDVAKAMGDAEATVKRFYVQTLEPGEGRMWFRPKLSQWRPGKPKDPDNE